MLSVHSLTAGYRNGTHTIPILTNITAELAAGTFTVLLGANGAGKSTLLRTLTGNAMPLSGTVCVDNKNIHDMSPRLRSLKIAIVNTERTNTGALTVEELVGLGRQPHTGFMGRLSTIDKEKTAAAMEAVGIAHKSQSFCANLSDGERQKAMIAKSIAQESDVIILDEPTAFLDVASRIETIALLRQLAETHNKAILLSTHDVGTALRAANNIWAITTDRHFFCGPAAKLISDGTMERIYSSNRLYFDPKLLDFRLS